ncbi:hypothetical protein [Nocardia suismassiliense]|uniref:hypothetical protein n=1 Tax=Nocardia suismassiliense TaxID=2077092 RepID=UPI00131EEFE8|nr:hypothetical protein [Nocardia suismassiliense]
MKDRTPIDIGAVARFETAQLILSTLIGYAGPLAAGDERWARQLDQWTQQLLALAPGDSAAVARVHVVDAVTLAKLVLL